MKNKYFFITFIIFLAAFIVKMFIGGLGVSEAILGAFIVGGMAFFKHNEKVMSDTEIAEFKANSQEELNKKILKLENEIGKMSMEKAMQIRR